MSSNGASHGGQISIMEALSRAESRNMKERSAGLNDLRHILQHNRENPELGNFDDKSFHKIFEVLFVIASDERSSYLKSLGLPDTSSKIKTAVINRFTNCSQILRLAVERGARNIRLRTLKALLDHLTDTLLDAHGNTCVPIALDYARCLSAVLAYEPHVEHLKEPQWHQILQFCLDRVQASLPSQITREPGLTVLGSFSSKLKGPSSRTFATTSYASETSEHLPKQAVDEFVACIRHLTGPASAPLLSRAPIIFTIMLQFLDASQSMSQAQVDALSAINNVLQQTRVEKLEMTEAIIRPLLQVTRRLWASRLVIVKNELLITLVLLHPYIRHSCSTAEDPGLNSDLTSMVDAMRAEYARRDIRDQLRLDDLDFSCSKESTCESLSHQVFNLKDGSAVTAANSFDGEHNWTLLRLLTYFWKMTTSNKIPDEKAESSPDGGRKRLRLTQWPDEMLRMLHEPQIPARVCSLQLVCFVAQSTALDDEILERIVEKLSGLASDENSLISSWALLALASCASQLQAKSKELSRHWNAIWPLAARLINSPSTCRASCHLMHVIMLGDLVGPSIILETCGTMMSSIEVNGPSTVSDASMSFLVSTVTRLRRENLASSKDGSERVLTWLFRTWAPSNFSDRIFAALNVNISPIDVLNLINACLGRSRIQQPRQTLPIWGSLAQSWIINDKSSHLIDYLLLSEDATPFLICWPHETLVSLQTSTSSITATESLVLGLAASEVNRALEQINYAKDQRGYSISRDMVRSVGSLAMVAGCLGNCHNPRDVRRASQLRASCEKLLDVLFTDLATLSCENQTIQAFLDLFAHCMTLSALQQDHDHDHGHDYEGEHKCMPLLAMRVTDLLHSRTNNTQSDIYSGNNGSDDGMDIDVPFLTDKAPQGRSVDATSYPKNLVSSSYHSTTQKMGVAVYSKLMGDSFVSADVMEKDGSALDRLTQYLTGLTDLELIASRPMIAALYDHVGHFSPENTGELLNRILDGPLRSYEHERSETTHALLLDITIREIANWTDPTNTELYQDGTDLYMWLTTTALKAKMLSTAVQKNLCDLLLNLLQIHPDYGQHEDLSSIRTTLFGMLQSSKLEVAHYLAERMSSIFKLYTLPKHDEVFDDLNASLPTDIEWMEGIAIRLLALAHIASNWPSLLRRCMYGIFETAGQIVSSTPYATHCVAYTSRSLDLRSSRDLFQLFAPQLLFTWLDLSRPLENVPFRTFGYDALKDLLLQNVDEVYSQLVVRRNDEEIKWLSDYLSMTEDRLMRAAFPKVVAYAMSWDIVFEGKHVSNPCETHLRSLVKTKGEYSSMVRMNFPYIIAQIFASLDQDSLLDKALEKKPKYTQVSDALMAMKSYSSSDRTLPSTQQPHFKAKYLLDQMERTVRRSASQHEIETFAQEFTPSHLTVVLRSVVDTMHPALGPLHACQVVRKLRILIAFAGENATHGYPLELLVRTLRPLAVESHCADDAIGVLHYLFQRGMPYLKTNMSTLTSTALLLLLSMKSFMVSRQDRTTQESQFRGTVSKMQAFHDWLVTSLLESQDVFSTKEDDSRKRIFTILLQSCRDLSLPASADRRNTASSMLQALMDDEQSKTPLLTGQERKQVVALLCRRFQSPELRSEDVFGSDPKSTDYARCIWSTTRSLSGADEYEAWAAKVLGRAFACSMSAKLIRPTGCLPPDFFDTIAGDLNSTSAIAAKLNSLLLSDDTTYVATSEHVIRKTIARFADLGDQDGTLDFESFLPPQVCEAMADSYSNDQTSRSLGRSSFMAKAQKDQLAKFVKVRNDVDLDSWVRGLLEAICIWASDEPLVGSMVELLKTVPNASQQLFPFIVHLSLQAEKDKEPVVRTLISESFANHFKEFTTSVNQKTRLMLETMLYLLTQPLANERTRLDRLQWLDVDYLLAAQAASRCNMPTTALYFTELSTTPFTTASTGKRSRRSSIEITAPRMPSSELLLDIYKNVDEPDSFYGVQQAPSLDSVIDRVDHEKDGLKGMMLHSARMDASLLRRGQSQATDSRGIIRSIGAMNFNCLTNSLLNQGKEHDATTTETMLESARKLQQWDIVPLQESASDSAMLYMVCKDLASTTNLDSFKVGLEHAMRTAHRKIQDPNLNAVSTRSALSSLAIMTEIDELTTIRGAADLHHLWDLMQTRQKSWDIGRFHDAQRMVSHRETLFGILSRNPNLRESLHVSIRDSRAIEMRAVIEQSRFAMKNDLVQQPLAAATYLSEMVPTCAEIGVKIDAVAQFEAASILWKQGDISSSVQMLQALRERDDLEDQTVQVGRAGLLAQLGHEVAIARLEKPEEIISQYLKPAIAQLKATSQGPEAGRVFHEFASFCDQQLHNPGNMEDYQRLERLRNRRKAELLQFDELISGTQSSQREKKKSLSHQKAKAKQWFTLDDQEYQKARSSRDIFVRQSLENYLRALKACDDFDSSVVRFLALWLEHFEAPPANEAVQAILHQVPSWKFVGLTNQLSSRLLDDGSGFQKTLSGLVARMSVDHPYHMVHNIYAGAQSAVGHGDKTGAMRKSSANKIKDYMRAHKAVGGLITRIWHSCHEYVRLAHTQIKPLPKNQKLTLHTVKPIGDITKTIQRFSVPPATLHLTLRPDANYQNIPIIVRFRSEIKVAGGLSAPKILTALATDGKEYKQLFKGGNDDLRQDAIMEQVFAEVSKMLQNHKATRQRSINVRTYKVLPLTANAGIIEFVPHSMPLAEFLNPAHARYHPDDMNTETVRKRIAEAAQHSKETRYKVYKEVTAQYHPVIRHFFFERFEDPDEWFERRLAYTRSTAAISILGYVLGLGDRHTQNVLLDEKSGEVIHIDLGVAFEAGRVLPIPEVVPFRLTRDIVDGFGITKTEGVFRRSCEFTMEALREEKDNIMTLLNVLRYDPLYSWTLSPLRAKRIQEAQAETEEGLEVPGSRKVNDEAGEADRALSVVEKKLSKTLSVAATVNELIQQATDERNLAVLFAGWAAYA